MGLLGEIFSSGDRMKRKLRGLLDDPMGTIALGSQRMSEDVQQMGLLADESGYLPGTNSVLLTPQQKERARKALADKGAEMAMAAATVWHGSPHKFDKFDSSKIGTGEGKQQQGIGAYLAEAKQVGQKYADKEAFKRGMDDGYLYKVDMPDESIAKMANHDAPFSQQPESVRNAVLPMFGEQEMHALKGYHGWENLDDAPFAAVMNSMEIAKGNNRAATSEALRKAGIPGIRYLDGGSRGAGQGSSNFVVFPSNEGLLSILERNGAPIGK